MEGCCRLPRSAGRSGKTAWRMERGRIGRPGRPRMALREWQTGQRRHACQSGERKDSVSVGRRGDLLSEYVHCSAHSVSPVILLANLRHGWLELQTGCNWYAREDSNL